MTLILCDPNLANEHGHHFDWDMAIAQAALAAGHGVRVLGHERFSAACPVPVPVEGRFTRTTYERRHRDIIRGAHDDFVEANAAIEADLDALAPGTVRAGDIVLFPTISERQLLGAVRWARRLLHHVQARVVFHLMLDCGASARQAMIVRIEQPLIALHYSLAFREAEGCEAIRFYGCGPQIARDYSVVARRPIAPHPLPMTPQVPRREPTALTGGDVRADPAPDGAVRRRRGLLSAGDAKPAKGLDLLPAIVPAIAAAHPEWDFVVHLNPASAGEAVEGKCRAVAAAAAAHPNVEVMLGRLDRDAYLALLAGVDLALLAYHPGAYARYASGILWEIISLGTPAVVPANTWVAREAESWQAGFATFHPSSAPAVVDAFSRAAAQIGDLEATALAARDRFRRENGADALVAQLHEA